MAGETIEIEVYTVVEARTVIELVRSTNLKTKKGWRNLGGMCFCVGMEYPFCQSMFKMEKPSAEKPVKQFAAYPYKGINSGTSPEGPSQVQSISPGKLSEAKKHSPNSLIKIVKPGENTPQEANKRKNLSPAPLNKRKNHFRKSFKPKRLKKKDA